MDAKQRASLQRRFATHLQGLLPQWPLSAPLLVAVSAGVDSSALLHLLRLCYPGPLQAAHFDHALRPCAKQDLAHVQQQCAQYAIPLHVGHWLPPAQKANLAAQARQARYRFLAQTAYGLKAPFIGIAHHQEDQAETLLERLLLRGAGLKGLSGMRPLAPLPMAEFAQVQLLRPLLPFSKKELTSWLQGEQITWREDPSNQDLRYTRNHIRHRLLPSLNALGVGEAIPQRLAETALHLQQADAALQWMVVQLAQQLPIEPYQENGLQLPLQPFAELPAELRARLLDHMLHTLVGITAVGQRAKENLWHHLSLPAKRWQMRMQGVAVTRVEQRLLVQPVLRAPGKRGETNH
ncbi:tRNA(Ile)-lysidine synthetase [Magnetococcus marinus MC-1]|uniref:tRNA(Ile)-lysidine synthase n=1 Tax=Magnetococcus marinus (strain ATCC BAA-1437 / JCM 17883 / MC-1) TaxID=156889 RepID=A0L4R9_MAGMM|nr:tRNA lysidine(34) synthetase TilS [Magnetococcus marinus]ABK42962.1 tRNA(Ile)-lysidine synthetase [Magnetococcus marinus MC-1]